MTRRPKPSNGRGIYGFILVLMGFAIVCLAPLLAEVWAVPVGFTVVAAGAFYGVFYCGWIYGL